MNYFDVGTQQEPVISNSSLNALDPAEGGGPQRFMNFFAEKEEEKEQAKGAGLVTGSLVHEYIEDAKKFVVSEVEKPTGDVGNLIDDLYLNFKNKDELDLSSINIEIDSKLKTDASKGAEILETRAAFTDLSILLGIDVDLTIRLFRLTKIQGRSNKNKEYYSSYKEVTTIDKLKPSINYFNALKSVEGKKVLTKKMKEAVTGCVDSLYKNEQIRGLLNLDKIEYVKEELEIIKEEPIYFDLHFVGFEDPDKVEIIKCKIKPDNLRINHNKKIITNIDLKTTGSSLYSFGKAFFFYNYHRQDAFYDRGILSKYHSKYPDYTIKHIQPVVETQGMFLSGIYQPGSTAMVQGNKEINSLLERFLFHRSKGIWNKSMEEIQNNGIMTIQYVE